MKGNFKITRFLLSNSCNCDCNELSSEFQFLRLLQRPRKSINNPPSPPPSPRLNTQLHPMHKQAVDHYEEAAAGSCCVCSSMTSSPMNDSAVCVCVFKVRVQHLFSGPALERLLLRCLSLCRSLRIWSRSQASLSSPPAGRQTHSISEETRATWWRRKRRMRGGGDG